MKYSCRFSADLDLNEFDEIILPYNGEHNQLIAFLQDHIDKRVVLKIEDIGNFIALREWEVLNAIHEEYPDFDIAICFYDI